MSDLCNLQCLWFGTVATDHRPEFNRSLSIFKVNVQNVVRYNHKPPSSRVSQLSLVLSKSCSRCIMAPNHQGELTGPMPVCSVSLQTKVIRLACWFSYSLKLCVAIVRSKDLFIFYLQLLTAKYCLVQKGTICVSNCCHWSLDSLCDFPIKMWALICIMKYHPLQCSLAVAPHYTLHNVSYLENCA